MEIPDVIAINKMDHPAAKTMLNEVRSILALDRDRDWRPPIVLTEALRGENVAELWGKIEEHRAHLESAGLLEERRRRNLAGEVFAAASSAREGAPAGDGRRGAGAARGCSTGRSRASSTRSRPCVRSWRRCSASTTANGEDSRAPTLADLEAARARIAGIARVTPVYPSETLSRLAGRPVQLKAENLQRTGSFKIRGAVNTIALARRRASAPRAWSPRAPATTARRSPGRRARPASPRRSSCRRTRRWRRSTPTRSYGARGRARRRRLRRRARRGAGATSSTTGATFIHAFEDERVIAGQGTIGLELAEQLPDVGTLVVPIGGGGLAAGIAIALRALRPEVRLVGVQAANMCPFAGGTDHGYTIADGIAVKQPGELTSAILRGRRSTTSSRSATRRSATRSCCCSSARSSLVEGAGAASVAALLAGKAGREDEVGVRPLRRQHRPDAADPGDAARAHAGGPLPRRPHAARRPPRRADQAARSSSRRSARTSSRSSTTARGCGSRSARPRSS